MKTFKPLSAILDGISLKLNKTFGDEYTVYTEEAKQGFSEPCFFISLLQPSSTKELGTTHKRENPYCIQFFPKSTSQPKTECYKILEALYLVMEYITVDGNPVRGLGMHGEMYENTLKFYVNYNVRVREIYDPILMKELQINLKTKG